MLYYNEALEKEQITPWGRVQGEYVYPGEKEMIIYGEKARFSTELERFFNQHDFITVDSTGNFTIGDDIVGKLQGETASGTFNINTDYKYFFQSPQQWVNKWNKIDGSYWISMILDGSFKHQIACKYAIRRRKVDDHFEYDVTYTGEGVWDNTMRRVQSVNPPVPVDYVTQGKGECYLLLEDINIGTESIGGDVKLEYTTTLK